MKASLVFIFLLAVASAVVVVNTLDAEPAPRLSLTVLANSTHEPGHLFARYSAGVSRLSEQPSTDLFSSSDGNTVHLNNSLSRVRYLSGAFAVANSSHELAEMRSFFGPLNQAPWWDHNFEKRRSVVVSEGAGAARQNEPVMVAVDFSDGEAYNDSLRMRRWDGIEHETVPFEVTSYSLDGSHYDSATLLFLANVSANGASQYQLYYSSSDRGSENYDPMDLNWTETHLVLNDTLQAAFRRGNMTGEGEIDSLFFDGVEMASYDVGDERGAYSFELVTSGHGVMRPTDNRNDESILFKELVVEKNTAVRTVVRRTSLMRGTLNEYYTFYRGSPYVRKKTEFFPFETIDIPATSYGGVREPDSSVSFTAHNNTFTWGGLGTRLAPYNWTTWYDNSQGLGFVPISSTLTPTDEYLLSGRVIVSYNDTDSSPLSLTASRYDFSSALVAFTGSIDMESWHTRFSSPVSASVSSPQESIPPQLFSGPLRSRLLFQPVQSGSLDAYTYVSLSAYRPEVKTSSFLFPRASFHLPVSLDAYNLTTTRNVTVNGREGESVFSGENRTVESFLGGFEVNGTISSAFEGAEELQFFFDSGVLSVSPSEVLKLEAEEPVYRRTVHHPASAENVLVREGALYHVNTSRAFSQGVVFEGETSSAHFFYHPTNATVASLSANLTPLEAGWLVCSLNGDFLFNFTSSSTTLLPIFFLEEGNNTLSCEAFNTTFEFGSADVRLSTVARPEYVWGGRWSMVPIFVDWHRNFSQFTEVSLEPSSYGLSSQTFRLVDGRGRELPLIDDRFNTTLQSFRANVHYLAYSDENGYDAPPLPGGEPASPSIEAGVEGSFSPRAFNPFNGPSGEEYPTKVMPPVEVSGSAEKVFVDGETGMGAVVRLVIWS